MDIKTVAPDKLEDLSSFNPLSIISLMVFPSGAVGVISHAVNKEVEKEMIIRLPDMEVDEYPKNTYRIFGINIHDHFSSTDAIGFNDKVLAVVRAIKKRMKRDGITNAFFPAFLKNEGVMQPWGAITSFFESEGDVSRFLRGGCVRIINKKNEKHLVFAHGKELMKSKISSFYGRSWDFVSIAELPGEIAFIGRYDELKSIIPITLSNGDVYIYDFFVKTFEKIESNIRAWVGETNIGTAFFRKKELVLRPITPSILSYY